MTRHPDWRHRLDEFLTSRRKAAFSWGVNDGAMFTADCIQALTGVDVATDFRGRYTDEAGALSIISAAGGLEAIVTAHLGPPLAGILLARMGDVVMATISDGRPCIGICLGGHCAFVSQEGLSKVRLSRSTLAWRVG